MRGQFLNAGYRIGVTEGQENTLQQGFDVAFVRGHDNGVELARLLGLFDAFDSFATGHRQEMGDDLTAKLSSTHDQLNDIFARRAELFQKMIADPATPRSDDTINAQVTSTVSEFCTWLTSHMNESTHDDRKLNLLRGMLASIQKSRPQ
ncbi:hypothetical protein PROFUN_15102 [Planoprotostelium fungivorum]|uniref:Essential protein Yae1 N-terminal domain-containing protein n=1 Tax=Planoprotostelium fungivorum TaxID=1890364 RepID=A0A2P6MZ76_9EUKA|nr:hypothetical protein PROFUN_15102 [Planoprotostelium fungivorum]